MLILLMVVVGGQLTDVNWSIKLVFPQHFLQMAKNDPYVQYRESKQVLPKANES